MDSNRDGKRKNYKHSDAEEGRREKKSKRARSRSRSPAETRERDSRRKRRHSKSRSPNIPVKHQNVEKEREIKKDVPERRARDTDMLNTRTGGAYIPPARLRMMQAQITDKSSIAYQRLAWEALKKSIHGHINKINVGNIGIIIKQLLKENIVRGRGLLCRSVIQAQAASPTFTNVYAALVAAVNSRFPNIGELLLKRLVIQFKRGFKRNDKPTCISSVSFVAHLINQRVAHEILALELLTLLVETPTDDSVEVAIAFLKECGQKLTEVSSKGVNAIFEMLRNILHEGQLDKRVQYMIEVMFQVWKDGFKDHPALIEELELVPEEEQFTHLLMLDDATDPQDILNVFKFDEKYEDNEQKYKTLSKEILGSDADSGDEEDGSGESGSEESEEDEEEPQKEVTIIDNTETNLIALRRTIYLTINSSLDFEECAHKLMKMQLKPGQEVELCHMFLDCCAEQRTYEKFYGLLAQRFCNINRIYIGPFEEIFKDSYGTAHRLDTNRLRNVSKFFAHLLFTDSISWEVMECVRLNEEDTTSSSRIYIKILFQELAEYMGLKKLNDRLKDPTLQEAFSGLFPRDNPKNTRFSINFFTSIGLGGLTDELREHLKQMPKNVPPPVTEIKLDSESSSDSSSDSSSSSSSDDSSSSSDSSSDSENEKTKSKKKKDKSKSKEAQNKEHVPKTPEDDSNKETERWGHDGFYDTYGKDARRTDTRQDGSRDNFIRPRDVRDRGEQRNIEDWKNRRNDRHENNEDFRRPNRSSRDDDKRRRDDGDERSRRGLNDNDRYGKDDDRRRRGDTDERCERSSDDRRNKNDRDDDRKRRNDAEEKFTRGFNDRSDRNDNDDDKRRRADVEEKSQRGSDVRSNRYDMNDSRRRRDETEEQPKRGSEDDANRSRERRQDRDDKREDPRSRHEESRSKRRDGDERYQNGEDSRRETRKNKDDDEVSRRDGGYRDDSEARRRDLQKNKDNDGDRKRESQKENRQDGEGKSREQRNNSKEYEDRRRDNVEDKRQDKPRKNIEDNDDKIRDQRSDGQNDESRRRNNLKHRDEDVDSRRDSQKNRDDIKTNKYKDNGAEERSNRGDADRRRETQNKERKSNRHEDKAKERSKKDKRRKEVESDEDKSIRRKDRRERGEEEDTTDSSEDEQPAPGRYWDVMDMKSGSEVLGSTEKARDRRGRS